MKKETPKIKKLKQSARRHSIKEGIFASAQASFGSYYISPFAIAVNASNSLVALITSITGLLGPLSQLFSSRLIEKTPRKKIVLKTVFWESLMWIPLIITAFLFYNNILTEMLPLLVLISFSISTIISNIAVPAWFSWMGDIVKENYRGRWFSKRNLIMGFISVILAITASFFLDYFKKQNLLMIGFIILFFLAFLSRLTCWKLFKKQYEPLIKINKKENFSFLEFIKQSPKNNFGKFTIYRALIGLTGSISAPLIAVYLLRYLEFNYTIYIIISLAGTLFSLFVIELWGKFADKYGNYKTIAVTSIIIPIIPFLWILSTSPIYFILIPSAIGGITWAGFNLATSNFIYDNVNTSKRSLAISYYNLLTGIGIFIGAGIGAFLIKFLHTTTIEPIILIFIIGGISRMIVTFFWIPKIKEVRKTKDFNSTKVLKNLIFKEAKPTFLEEAHEIMSINKYLK